MIWKTICLLLVAAFIIGCAGKPVEHQVRGSILEVDASVEVIESVRVDDVSSGDTIRMRNIVGFRDGDEVKYVKSVKYIGMDAPRRGEPFHKPATELNKKLVDGKKVRLVFDEQKIDRSGRFLAYVYVENPSAQGEEKTLFVNQEMIKKGYAKVPDAIENTRYLEQFRSLEAEARELRLGIWKYADEGNDEELKTVHQQAVDVPDKEEFKYVASRDSDVFHKPNCSSAKRIKEENKVFYHTYKEAMDDGKRPCKQCDPEDRDDLK